VLGIATGARPESLCELTWGQIDREANIIDLNPSHRVQTSKYRPIVKIPPSLGVWLDAQPKVCDYIVHFRKKPTRRYHEAWKRAKAKAKLEGTVTPYSLRHAVARWLRMKGVPAWEVAAQLGHSAGSRFTITEIYAAHSPDYLMQTCAALDELVALVLRGGCFLDSSTIAKG
jgi:integrase